MEWKENEKDTKSTNENKMNWGVVSRRGRENDDWAQEREGFEKELGWDGNGDLWQEDWDLKPLDHEERYQKRESNEENDLKSKEAELVKIRNRLRDMEIILEQERRLKQEEIDQLVLKYEEEIIAWREGLIACISLSQYWHMYLFNSHKCYVGRICNQR